MRKPSHGTVVAYVALTIAMSGSAYAATGGSFLLGKSNQADRPSAIVNTGTGPALTMRSQPGSPPFSVANNTRRVTGLNADLVDGVHASALQRRVTGTCAAGSAVTAITAGGTVSCSATSATSYFAVLNADGTLVRGSAGVTSTRTATGVYRVVFPVDVTNCAYTATVGTASAGSEAPSQTSVAPLNGNAHGVYLQTASNGANSNLGSHVIVAC
jgi:hypothetical protein